MLRQYLEQPHINLDSGRSCLALEREYWQAFEVLAYEDGWHIWLPDIPIWCVTRIPEFSRQLANVPYLWVHFSLDRSSLDRYTLLGESLKSTSNLFFSYQCEPDENLKKL